MENKLYYDNPYIKSFQTKVIQQTIDPSGKPYVVLEKTAFYPTGGGQPHDTGTIHDVKVVNVEETDGEIRHYLEKDVKLPDEIIGEVDWNRRFDHMQQHAGQHILSAAFENLFGYKTVSFHLGTESLTIDLDIEQLTEHDALAAEKLANTIILENRPIETKWVTNEELSQYTLRKELSVTDDIRLVIIPDFDYNGCGGTHPKETGQVRAIKILDWERQKKKTRVQFICGNRVIEQFHQKQQILLELTRLLNAPEKEMGSAVQRLIESGKEQSKTIEMLKDSLLQYEADQLINEFLQRGEMVIGKLYQNRTIQELQKLARLIAAANNTITFICVAENENRIQIVGAKGSQSLCNMQQLISGILPLINGKGGGNESFAQGGGERLLPGKDVLKQLMEQTGNVV
nr:alanine--tRNA ligase-related protein [Neobacillus sp. Marseille-Q6967]